MSCTGVLICLALISHSYMNSFCTPSTSLTCVSYMCRWERMENPDTKGKMGPHKHAFKRVGPNRPYTHVQAERRPHTGMRIDVQSGFRGLDILKTTQSGFVGFPRDKFTTLPEATDRILATSLDAEWHYIPLTNMYEAGIARVLKTDFNKLSVNMEAALVNTFAGPSDTGVYRCVYCVPF